MSAHDNDPPDALAIEPQREDIPTGKLAICLNCQQPIAQVKDPYSGVLDWYSDGGDFGCSDNPNNDEGVDSHIPEGE